MGELADSRNGALRALYEEFHAPLALLELLVRKAPGRLTKRAQQEGWERQYPLLNLQGKMLKALDAQLTGLSLPQEHPNDGQLKTAESEIKLLTMMAKTLDALAVTQARLAASPKSAHASAEKEEGAKNNKRKNEPDESIADDPFYFTPEGEAELNRQIADMVEKMP